MRGPRQQVVFCNLKTLDSRRVNSMAESERSERTLAVFFDFENLALGLKDKKEGHFDIQKVLERLVEKGKIVVKKAYSDWSRYSAYKQAFHAAGV
jgi:hypothetical protein